MQYAIMGNTGLEVSRLSVGTDVLLPPGELLPILRRAREFGVNFIDTDHSYSYERSAGEKGQTWEAVRRWLPEVERDEVVLAAKTYKTTKAGALEDAEDALIGLGTDYVDIFLLHGLNDLEDWDRFEPALEGCLQARDRGLVRTVGISTHTVTMARKAAEIPELEVLLVTLNLTGKVMKRSGSPEEMQEAMRVLHEQGRGLYIMKSLARGRVFDDSEDESETERRLTPDQVERALTYVFECPWAQAVTIGMRRLEDVDQNAAIANKVSASRSPVPA